MSKTFEESSASTIKMYWKQLEALVIGYARKYRHDPFFRTEMNVLGLQTTFTVIILGVVYVATSLLYQGISQELLSGALTAPLNALDASTTAANIAALKTNTVLALGAIIFIVTAVFGYLIMRLALAPARNALESQKQFIGNIAHELRTPLSIIKTNTEVRLLDKDVPSVSVEMLRDNLEELDRISDIINNLLSLNVLVSPEDITFNNVDMGLIVERMMRHLEQLIERKKLKITLEMNEYRTVWGNPTALEQIILNVLRNAANYTPTGRSIKVTVKPDYAGYVVFGVEDSGVGISEKDLRRIFEPFYRADQSRARTSGGSGLGLAIVSELVKVHRGQITIRSAEKRGTAVFISLPAGKNAPQEAEKNEGMTEVEVNYFERKSSA